MALAASGIASSATAQEPTWVDARAALSVQTFQQALVPGVPGLVAPVETALPVTLTGYLRVLNADLPGAQDALSAEVAAWARGGPRDGTVADGDVTSAYVRAKLGVFQVKLGRQVVVPGSARYVRFDGVDLHAQLGMLDLEAYAGFVALPRWSQARGAWMLGFVGDALADPRLREAQNRVGQFTLGARAAVRPLHWLRASASFHEQHDEIGAAVRIVSADAALEPVSWLAVGGRATFDLRATAFSEVKAWADVVGWEPGAASVDYAFQSPSLLLPQTSILAAFGGASWHEAGGEVTVRLPGRLRLTGRGAAQLYEGDRPGGRGLARLRWEPGFDGRWMLLAEGGRVLVSSNGLTQARLAARLRATRELSVSFDGAVFLYDSPVAGARESITGTLSGEWAATRNLRFLLSGTMMRTPWAAFEMQGLARVVFLLDPVSTGGVP